MTTSPTATTQYGSSQQRSQGAPSRSKSLGRAVEGSSKGNNGNSSNSKSKQGRGGTTSPPYRDVIDKLDLSGLLGGGFHHSGPFDAASSMQRSNAPIAAFSQSALDPAYSGSPTNNASPNGVPLRESSYPRQARAGGNGTGNGISARAKATLAAMGGTEPHFNDPDNSSENLLSGMPSLQRRNSDNQSITLGYPSNETHAKERKILEAFGVHEEAYLDYGNSSYARKPPRASVAPSPNSSMTSFASTTTSPTTAREQTGIGKMTRADRTASIWDIEATLREGRPVGAAPPPPMPVIPDRFLQAPAPTSPTNGEGGVKRSKSLLARMRSRKGAMISSPSSKETSHESSSFSNSAGPAPLPYERTNSNRSASNEAGREKEDYASLYDSALAVDAGSTPDYYYNDQQRLDYNDGDRRRPDMGSRRSTSPVEQRIANNYLKPTMTSPNNSGYAEDGTYGQGQPSMARSQSSSSAPRRSPQPPSPLGLPEGPGDIFGGSSGDPYNSGSGLKHSISRSHKNGDLANESALAAILAESSSKESGMSHSTSSSSNNSGYGGGGNGNSSGYGYAHTDTSYASDKTSTPDRSRLESNSLGNSTASNSPNNTPSPAEGKLSRKTSLASRLLRGRKKPSS